MDNNKPYVVYCKKCYNETTSAENFCPKCGEPLKEGFERQAPYDPNPVPQTQYVEPQTPQPAKSTIGEFFKALLVASAGLILFVVVSCALFLGACMLFISGLGG